MQSYHEEHDDDDGINDFDDYHHEKSYHNHEKHHYSLPTYLDDDGDDLSGSRISKSSKSLNKFKKQHKFMVMENVDNNNNSEYKEQPSNDDETDQENGDLGDVDDNNSGESVIKPISAISSPSSLSPTYKLLLNSSTESFKNYFNKIRNKQLQSDNSDEIFHNNGPSSLNNHDEKRINNFLSSSAEKQELEAFEKQKKSKKTLKLKTNQIKNKIKIGSKLNQNLIYDDDEQHYLPSTSSEPNFE